jgi:hypothetical protein
MAMAVRVGVKPNGKIFSEGMHLVCLIQTKIGQKYLLFLHKMGCNSINKNLKSLKKSDLALEQFSRNVCWWWAIPVGFADRIWLWLCVLWLKP